MLKKIYANPYKVYLVTTILVLIGLYCSSRLTTSLFPIAQRPAIGVWIPYGPYSDEQFYHEFGTLLEDQFKKIEADSVAVTSVTSKFHTEAANFEIQFDWGTSFSNAKKEIKNIIQNLGNQWPKEIRDNYGIWPKSRSSGFYLTTFSSRSLDMTQIFDIINPILRSPIGQVQEIEEFFLWNPSAAEIIIELDPYALSTLGITPLGIEVKVREYLSSFQGGQLVIGDAHMQIINPKGVQNVSDLEKIPITIPSTKTTIPLAQLANIFKSSGESVNNVFKTNGLKGIMLYARPKQGANIKTMSNKISAILKQESHRFPDSIQTYVMIDPSTFIDNSVSNVMHEVALSAFLAVIILFLFIGGITNTFTAAIEIPMSMILAFIIMKIDGMNINLISLAGLALASGMNVDASIVVMENIFTKIRNTAHLPNRDFLEIIYSSVKEVLHPLMSSTLISLVVFVPLIFTSNISQAILGDLAKAVVYSHGISLFVAILVVPTIRLHLFQRQSRLNAQMDALQHPPLEKLLIVLEEKYETALKFILQRTKLFIKLLFLLVALIITSIYFIHPRLPSELIGKPDSDWVELNVHTTGHTMVNQMEEHLDKVEAQFKALLGDKLLDVYYEIWGANGGQLLGKIKNKRDMDQVIALCEKEFVNSSKDFFKVKSWNPAELPLPDPPQGKVYVTGKDSVDIDIRARDFYFKLMDQGFFSTYNKTPGIQTSDEIRIRPKPNMEMPMGMQEISQYLRVILENYRLGEISINNQKQLILMKFPHQTIKGLEEIQSWPIKVGKKIIPLKAIVDIERVSSLPSIVRENGQQVHVIEARLHQDRMNEKRQAQKSLKNFVKEYGSPFVSYEDADIEIKDSLKEVISAILISIFLMFLILYFQFGKLPIVGIIMTAIPTGIFGVYVSLFIMNSTLSLNSTLGMILLNGLTVANSIIMIDFILMMLKTKDYNLEQAIIYATKVRLRPILMTALTTILGMLPIAMGLGDGGKIIRPLGISVVGGLSLSTFFTLFIVPLLTFIYLKQNYVSIEEKK